MLSSRKNRTVFGANLAAALELGKLVRIRGVPATITSSGIYILSVVIIGLRTTLNAENYNRSADPRCGLSKTIALYSASRMSCQQNLMQAEDVIKCTVVARVGARSDVNI